MFYKEKTFENVLERHQQYNNTITFITLYKENPTGYGRVIYDKKGNFKKIVEEKDATAKEKNIHEVNDGVYLINRTFLEKYIKSISPSPITGEFYLTDLINIALKYRYKVGTYLLENSKEFYGISTQQDLIEANQLYCTIKNI